MDDLVQRKELIRYLPDFMKQFFEFQEIMSAEDLQFARMDSRLQTVLNNAFIEDADEYGIRKYERLLEITAVPGESLEVRKNRVRAYWCVNRQYSYRVFVRSLDMLLGGNWNYDIICDQEHYTMTFHVYQGEHLGMLEAFLQKVLPLNIFYKVHLTKDWVAGNYFGAVWQEDELLEWR
ncbi:MAG: YmfQ family protein [Acetatifactor sp.]|nr:YmfQ family protein [Acetatifactor sp.]